MSRWDDIKALLDVPHPVSGAWDLDDALAAAQMNALDVVRIKASMTGSEIWAATDPDEYSSLTNQAKTQWLSFCAIENHNPEAGGLAQSFVISIFGGGSTTVGNLAALRNETVSLGQEQGVGNVRTADITYARTL